MLERLRAFHEDWAGREKDLRHVQDMPRDASDAGSFQYGLVEALGHARNWLLSDDEVNEIEKLTLGSERENVARWHWQSPLSIEVTISSDGHLRAGVGNGSNTYTAHDVDELGDKLSQYPAGTVFQLTTSGREDRIALVVRIIKSAAAAHGLLVRMTHQ